MDKDGFRYQLIDHIMDHRKDNRVVPMPEAFTVSGMRIRLEGKPQEDGNSKFNGRRVQICGYP